MSQPPTALTKAIDRRLADIALGPPGPARLKAQLRQLAKWRSIVLANTLAAKDGARVVHGPFAGMDYRVAASEGGRARRLLGSYEASPHPVIETVIARGYPQLIDIGCAESYYAVGLARRMPATTVHARDSDPGARRHCGDLARANGVADRVRIGPAVSHADLALCAEADLLDPALAPALAEADLLVEVHEAMHPGLLASLAARFAPTHRVSRIDHALRPDLLPDWADTLSDLDRLLLLWEWRAGPTPWLWMERR